jgi:hypothetical protein
MRWDIEKCPTCGEEVSGTLETVQGQALVTKQDDGSFEYSGQTRMFWDGQETLQKDGKDVLMCQNGHEWTSTRIED